MTRGSFGIFETIWKSGLVLANRSLWVTELDHFVWLHRYLWVYIDILAGPDFSPQSCINEFSNTHVYLRTDRTGKPCIPPYKTAMFTDHPEGLGL